MSHALDLLLALFGDHDGVVRFDGHQVGYIDDVDKEEFKTVDGLLDDGRVAFLFTVRDLYGADVDKAIDIEITNLPPTAILQDGKTLLVCYALTDPAPSEGLTDLAEALGMDGVDEPIPLPGKKWALAYLDDRNHYRPADLYPPPWEVHSPEPAAAAPAATYGDAKLIAPYDEADPVLAQMITVTLGADQFSKKWKPKEMPLGALVAMFSQHKVGPKDGPGVVLGDQVPGQRVKSAVKAMYAVGLDLDDGVPSAEVDKALLKLGCMALRYTTHSHLKTVSKFPRDALVKWSNKNADGAEVDDDLVQRYMTEKGKIDQRIVATASIIDTVHETSGLMVLVQHEPIPKHRIIIPLAAPFVIAKQGGSQVEAQDKWKKVVRGVGDTLCLPIDEACLDVSRLFYLPRHDKGSPHEISLAGGPLFDFASLTLENPWEDEVAAITKGKGRSTTDAGKQLGRWSMKAAHGFQIVQVLEDFAPERMRNQTSTGWEIECPFDEEHSNPGDQEDRACLAVNAGDGPSEIFTISCRHESCRERTNLDMLGKMVEDQWFGDEVLHDETYNIAEVEDAPNVEAAQRIDKEDKAKAAWQAAVDALSKTSNESEIAEAIRHTVEASLGSIDMERAKDQIVKATGLKVTAVGKKIKEIEKEVARELNEAKGAQDPHGRIIFSYQGEPHFDEAYDVCFKALKKENRKEAKPIFCCVQDQAVRLTEDAAGKVSFQDLTSRSMWAELNERCTFIRLTDSGAAGPRQQVPTDVASHVFERAYTRLPQAPEVVYTPLFVTSERAGPELITEPGWYGDINLMLAETDFVVPKVYDDPTDDEVATALDTIAFELLGDFPFLDHDEQGHERRESSLANAMAMLLTPFMRRLIDGCTPVFFITKPEPGTGGTTLGQLPAILFDGEYPTPEAYSQNEEEMRKSLLASVMNARSHLFFDDVKDFNNRVLLQSITSRHIGGRLLGATKTIQRPNTFNWTATGNNPTVLSEMDRRVVWIRLNQKMPKGQQRVYRNPLPSWAMENRSLLVHSILVLIQHWIVCGMPKFKERKRASFEDWGEKVGGVLMTADKDDKYNLYEGFLNNRRTQGSDPEEASIRAFVRAWFDRWGKQRVTQAELFSFALDGDMDICDGNNDDQKKSRFYRRLPLLDGRTFTLKDGLNYMVRAGFNEDEITVYSFEVVEEDDVVPAE